MAYTLSSITGKMNVDEPKDKIEFIYEEEVLYNEENKEMRTVINRT